LVKVVLIASIIKLSVILNISFHLSRYIFLKIHHAYQHFNGPSKMWVRISHGIAMRRSRISEIFIREGLKWRHDETWFGERVDPDFAKKEAMGRATRSEAPSLR
jgi:hypothetical protein